MPTVTVLKFAEVEGANKALDRILELQKQHLLKVHDGAIVSWAKGKKRPTTRQLVDLVGAGAFGGMFWGMLLGVIFAVPLLGMAVGAALGALNGAFHDYGIDDKFIEQVRTKVTEGTSALFLMTSDAVVDRVAEGLKDLKFELVATNLSRMQEEALREVFGLGKATAAV